MVIDSEDIQLLNLLQKDFPLQSRPFVPVAAQLGRTEAEIVARLTVLQSAGVIGRLGAVFNHEKAGASTLVAMAVPTRDIEVVAQSISDLPQVNHNYLREDSFNLWFVVTAANRAEIDDVLNSLAQRWPNYPCLNLPMEKGYHIDLGFPLC